MTSPVFAEWGAGPAVGKVFPPRSWAPAITFSESHRCSPLVLVRCAFLKMFSEKCQKMQRALFLTHNNCLCFYVLHLLTHKSAEEAGIGDTPNLEDQAAGHVTQGQWLQPPTKAWGVAGGSWKPQTGSALKR